MIIEISHREMNCTLINEDEFKFEENTFQGAVLLSVRDIYIWPINDEVMTTQEQLNQRKFPIGPFVAPETVSESEFNALVETIASAPALYRSTTKDLSQKDLGKSYREGGWNIQQIVNHVADMQLLHFFRMKKALTESDYKEITLVNIDGWANTSDGLTSPVEDSLDMFEAIAKRFVHLIRSLDEKQQEIAYYHPVRKTMLNQKQAIAMSAWHVRHHLEHIKIALAGQ